MIDLVRWRAAPGLIWRHASPDELAGQLQALGSVILEREPDGRTLVDVGGASLEIVPAGHSNVRLELAARPHALPRDGAPPASLLAGVALATIDLERWSGGDRAWEVEEPLLGARGFASAGVWPVILVLEPARDARLAAALARFGEGPAALYVVRRTADGAAESPPPWEGGRLVPPFRPWGPFLITGQGLPAGTSHHGEPSRGAACDRRSEHRRR